MKEINEKTTIKSIDNTFLFFEDNQIKIDLKKTHEYGPIELVTILHFILTHLQSNLVREIHTNISDNDYDQIQKKFFDHYILVCCLLFRPEVTIRNKNGKEIYTKDWHSKFISKLKSQEELYLREINSNHAKDLKERFFSATNKSKNNEGLSFLVPCFDHLADDGLDKSTYFYNPLRTKGPMDIEVWFKRLFQFNDLEICLPHIFYDLSIVINELMQNTSDWARTSFDDEKSINPNIRACAVNIFLEKRLQFEHSSYDDIQDYVKQIYDAKKEDIYSPERQIKLEFTNESIGICEISILDTGPGMASRWLKRDYKNIAKTDEINGVIECFHKYITSDNSSRTQLRGRGLSNVIGIIGFNGLIRVRTGRVLLVRNFFQHKIQSDEIENQNIEFNSIGDNMPLVGGTTISVLYPFVYTSKTMAE